VPFLTDLRLKPVGDNDWELLDNFDYGTNNGRLIRIPKGFTNDLASIPRVFRLLIPVNGKHREAAVLHDYLYHSKGLIYCRRRFLPVRYTREESDKLFLEAMISCAVPVWKRNLMYWAVRVGGRAAWNDSK
jgi:hypothetical protein